MKFSAFPCFACRALEPPSLDFEREKNRDKRKINIFNFSKNIEGGLNAREEKHGIPPANLMG